MKRIDWDRLVPLGMEGDKVRNKLLAVLGIFLFNILFLLNKCLLLCFLLCITKEAVWNIFQQPTILHIDICKQIC